MSKTPPEDLVVIARKLDPDFHAKVVGVWNDEPWRMRVPLSLRKIWGRLDYSERLVAFIFANTYGGGVVQLLE
jgi:hypothetical protein